MDHHFISEKPVYEASRKKLDLALRSRARLPEQVFQESFGSFAFFEFDLMLSESFWPVLKSLAALGCDSQITLTMLDPDPEDYYFKHFGRYAALNFGIHEDEVAYSNALNAAPPTSPADVLLYAASIVTWHSPSLAWALWGERQFGIGVLGFSVPIQSLAAFPKEPRLFTASEALWSLVALNFRNQEVPPNISAQLIANYGK